MADLFPLIFLATFIHLFHLRDRLVRFCHGIPFVKECMQSPQWLNAIIKGVIFMNKEEKEIGQ